MTDIPDIPRDAPDAARGLITHLRDVEGVTEDNEVSTLGLATAQLVRSSESFADVMRRTIDAVQKVIASPGVLRACRMQDDREYIQRLADHELREASEWLDDHVDSIYADLGLERPV